MSQLSGKQSIALSYQEKFFELMEATGQGSYCFPIDSFNLVQLEERFLALVKNGEHFDASIDSVINQYRDKLDEQYEVVFSYI